MARILSTFNIFPEYHRSHFLQGTRCLCLKKNYSVEKEKKKYFSVNML